MIGAWVLLGGRAFGKPMIAPKTVMIALGVNTLLAVGGFALLFIEVSFSAEERVLFTHYQYALAPAPIFIGLLAAIVLLRTPVNDGEPARAARVALALSLVLFFQAVFWVSLSMERTLGPQRIITA